MVEIYYQLQIIPQYQKYMSLKIMDATYFFHKELFYMIETDYDLEHNGNLRIFYRKDSTKKVY
jgi:hypothetical protein